MSRVAPVVDLKVPLMHFTAAFPTAAAPGLVLCVDGCSPDSVAVWDVSYREDARCDDPADGCGPRNCQRTSWGSEDGSGGGGGVGGGGRTAGFLRGTLRPPASGNHERQRIVRVISVNRWV